MTDATLWESEVTKSCARTPAVWCANQVTLLFSYASLHVVFVLGICYQFSLGPERMTQVVLCTDLSSSGSWSLIHLISVWLAGHLVDFDPTWYGIWCCCVVPCSCSAVTAIAHWPSGKSPLAGSTPQRQLSRLCERPREDSRQSKPNRRQKTLYYASRLRPSISAEVSVGEASGTWPRLLQADLNVVCIRQ